MKWNEIFSVDCSPSEEDIKDYLGGAKILWSELAAYIEEVYQVKPQNSYSKDALQPGWNVKYKKSGKSLCTLYPMAGYFIALVVVGAKEEIEVKTGMEEGVFTPYVKELYDKTAYSPMGRWLMIAVKDEAILNDMKHLLGVRVRPNRMIGIPKSGI